ncbi:MAG: bifunctional riboflavin kinase/FAD synthetase [Bdellovibrionales bacterium]|nr:bifunctional riboflavin kinase/FAD synthetase [Bdellovibrionales bacterium]
MKEIPNHKISSVLSLGNFDGVHRGHQELFARQKKMAQSLGLKTQALVLFPHPSVVLGFQGPATLMKIEDRVEKIRSLGIDHVFTLPFTTALSQVSAQDFVALLRDQMGMKALCIGETTHLGRKREGSPSKLKQLCKAMDISVEIVKAKQVDKVACSSTLIRALLARGEIQTVNALLGYDYFLRAKVVKGKGVGKEIGFPTANLGEIDTMLPAQGVYASYVQLEGKALPAATNVGVRPTLGDSSELTVEVHILDQTFDLYGKNLTLHWKKRIRKEKKYSKLESLKKQISRDLREVKELFDAKNKVKP